MSSQLGKACVALLWLQDDHRVCCVLFVPLFSLNLSIPTCILFNAQVLKLCIPGRKHVLTNKIIIHLIAS